MQCIYRHIFPLFHCSTPSTLSLLVVPDDFIPELTAVHVGFKLGAHQERPTQLSIQTVRLLRWWRESMGKHDGNQ